ncbi:hypothetical protein AVEN_97304-1 [Araneus ventricosus]|uniref:Uncharacterized protein n=1 Tax=Araneus ventricosus TaxID=182803 RepID=A0A4Y2W0S4_ARAVE|nr:hypothetical protein AVEN_79719-1 [Araneus ventricosus]GBO30471.1 hypothetical protein AVEN_97304-1 [Araneus ventricosus]
MDPFSAPLKGSISVTQIVVPLRKWATLLHFATSCPLTVSVSFHMKKPSDHLTEHWWKLPLQQILRIQNDPTSELRYR